MKKIAMTIAAATVLISSAAQASYVPFGATNRANVERGVSVGMCDLVRFSSPLGASSGIPDWLPCHLI